MSTKKVMGHFEGQLCGECVSLRRIYPDGTVQPVVIPVDQLPILMQWFEEWLEEGWGPDEPDPDGGIPVRPTEGLARHLGDLKDAAGYVKGLDSGRVSFRKVFPGAYSNNTDRYFGAGLVIVAPAADPAVDVLMTSTGDFTDELAGGLHES
jgi:hypothetical protein